MTSNPNPALPSHPEITDYGSAVLAVDDMGPPLSEAIIAAIPSATGIARYVYDYSKLIALYARFRSVDLDDIHQDDDEEVPDSDAKVIRHPSYRTNAERYEEICEAILDFRWGFPSGAGLEPLLVTDPAIESLMLDAREEEPESIMIGGREYWFVTMDGRI